MSFFKKQELAPEEKKGEKVENLLNIPKKQETKVEVKNESTPEPEKPKYKQAKPSKIKDLVMGDGVYCINDQSLVQIVNLEPPFAEEKFENVSKFHDPAAAHFFQMNKDA